MDKLDNIIKKVLQEGDTYEKMAAKGKKAGNLKQGTVRKRLGIKKDEKIPLSKINKEISRLKKMDKDKDKKGVQLGDKNQKYYKALQLSKTLKTTTNVNENKFDKAAMDEYGKPFLELSIAQKQELLSYMNRETEKQFQTDYERRRRGDYSDDMEDGMTDFERSRRETSDYMNEESKKYFGVFQKGGSIGQGKDEPLYSFVDKEEAKQKAKRLRQTLTPGEKSYYGMGYIVKPTNVAPESLKEGKIDRVVGGRPYDYVGDGRKGQAIVSGPMKDREKEAIIKRAKEAGYIAKPNMGGGVTIQVESLNEDMGEWPKELKSRYSDEYRFELEKVMSNRAKYRVIDIESGELKGTPVFGTPESLMAFADDLIKPQGGTQSTNLGEDINDPVLMRTRAAQMKRDAIEKKDLENKSKRISAEKAVDLRYELSILNKEREDILMRIEDLGFETEQTAEPEGGKKADDVGKRMEIALKDLRNIDSKIIDIKDDLGIFDMNEIVNEDKIDEEIETSLTPNEIGDELIGKEYASPAFESLYQSLKEKLNQRLGK